jgi:protein-S-isoprenylcysteine O-methyltransferase Ste14
MNRENNKLNSFGWRMIIREYISRILILILLLVSSGDRGWPQAWLFFWLLVGMNIIFHIVVVIPDPELYNERGSISPKTERWDKSLLIFYALSGYMAFIMMGLDHRFGWTHLNEAFVIPGAILMGISFALSAWSMRVNRFFSSVVRIQEDRGQVVCDRGPYRLIRHPGYFSGFLFYLGSPMMLGSLMGFLFVPIIIGLFVYRIIREEELLAKDLQGYLEYQKKVRYRLIPGIW